MTKHPVTCERCGAQLGYVISTIRGRFCKSCHDQVWADVPEMVWNQNLTHVGDAT